MCLADPTPDDGLFSSERPLMSDEKNSIRRLIGLLEMVVAITFAILFYFCVDLSPLIDGWVS